MLTIRGFQTENGSLDGSVGGRAQEGFGLEDDGVGNGVKQECVGGRGSDRAAQQQPVILFLALSLLQNGQNIPRGLARPFVDSMRHLNSP